jgi:hypothetical protein
MCLQGFYIDLLTWQVGPDMIWYKMLVVSLCQLRYFQEENILFFDFSRCPGVQAPFVDTAGYIPSVGYIREPR